MALSSCPPPAGSEAAAEGEGRLPVLVLAPGSKWHYDNRAVVLRAKLLCLRGETKCHHQCLTWKGKQVSGFTWDSTP